MKKDIENTCDIAVLVNSFYDKAKADATIGYIFNDIAKVNWAKHLPVMYSFWEQVLFGTGSYKGNTIAAHNDINSKVHFTKVHFDIWVGIFKETVDDLFSGDKAELAKQRAMSIATIMQLKFIYKDHLSPQ